MAIFSAAKQVEAPLPNPDPVWALSPSSPSPAPPSSSRYGGTEGALWAAKVQTYYRQNHSRGATHPLLPSLSTSPEGSSPIAPDHQQECGACVCADVSHSK